MLSNLAARIASVGVLMLALVVPAPAQTGVLFSYQGRVKVHGQPFNGTGQFKFAILDSAGSETLWSNDGTSVGGGQPASSIPLVVEDGVFGVLVGDVDAGMEPISATIFQNRQVPRLRVWFSNGTDGFERLEPDYKLVNFALTSLETGPEDFSLYVNGLTGNDAASGLTPARAKRTIQAAINALPPRIRCNVTIEVADGDYKESVRIYGFSVEPGKTVTILGDETWTPASPNPPAVRLLGSDSDAPGAQPVRSVGVVATKVSGIVFRGIWVDNYSTDGITLNNTEAEIRNCRFTRCRHGLYADSASLANVNGLDTRSNRGNGILIAKHCTALLTGVNSTLNQESGVHINGNGNVSVYAGCSFSNNTGSGMAIQHDSFVVFTNGAQILNNDGYGLTIVYNSYVEAHTACTIANNDLGNVRTLYGGMTTY